MVFRAQDTIYRLFPDILSSCSPVFQGLFTVPQPSSQETYEGLPLITLPDQSGDLTALFEAIYAPQDSHIFLSSATSDAYPLEKTLGVLKLSTKYQIEYLRYQALRLLCADHVPLTFDAFDHKGTKWSKSTTTAMKILPVARQCNAIWLLPTLFYLSCALPTDETHDPDEFTQADIDLMDERRIWRGRSLLIQANNREICAPLRMPCDSMELDCSNSKIDLLDSWLDGCPLEFIAWKPTGLCANCLPLMKQEVETAKRRFWHSIPYLFDLPPWEELRKQQDIDLGYAPGAQTDVQN